MKCNQGSALQDNYVLTCSSQSITIVSSFNVTFTSTGEIPFLKALPNNAVQQFLLCWYDNSLLEACPGNLGRRHPCDFIDRSTFISFFSNRKAFSSLPLQGEDVLLPLTPDCLITFQCCISQIIFYEDHLVQFRENTENVECTVLRGSLRE